MWNQDVAPAYKRIGLKCSSDFSYAKPGQFVTVKAGDTHHPLLRRPFSIHRRIFEKGIFTGIEILYRIVGDCTRRLAAFTPGQTLDLLGPLGNSFPITDKWRRVFIVGGGIGVAPLAFLVETLQEKGIDLSECAIFIGGRTDMDVLCRTFFKACGIPLHVATDDGSAGHKGLVTDLVSTELESRRPDAIYACGPMPMLKTTRDIAKAGNIPCRVSIETIMACGLGVCLGCAVEGPEKQEKYKHVCIDGPVFDAADIKI